LSGEESRAWSLRGFGAALEEPLHAHTDSQKRNAASDGFQDSRTKIAIQSLAPAKMSDPRHDQLIGFGNHLWIIGDLDLTLRRDVLQRLLDRADVARAVIDNGDHRRPLVLG